MSRLGCQAQRSTPEALAFARRSPIVKGVNSVDVLKEAPADAIRIFRWVFDNQNLADPASAFGTILGRLGGYRHPNLYVETFNELPKESLHAYIEFLKQIVPMFHALGIKVLGPSWATGDYEQGDWDAFRQAGWCGLDAIAVHGYWADRGFSQWNALRWRTYYEGRKDRHLMVVCTECGRDRVRDGSNGAMVGQGGWKADGLSAEAYAAELNAYGDQLLPHEWATPFVSGAEPNWHNYDIDSVSALLRTSPTPPPQPQQQGGTVPVADFTSPNHEGPRAQTLGVVIHATFGDSANAQTEYTATCDYFQNPAPGGDPRKAVSAHAVAGPGGAVHRPVKPELIAWHCSASNKTHLGIEMAKPRLGDRIAPDILDGAAKVVARWCQDYKIPIVWNTAHGLAEHHEMPTNTDGHSDVGGPFDRADFLNRVKRYAGQGDELTDAQRTAVLDDLGLIWGMAKADTIRANPAESERAIHERVVAIKVALGING